MAVTIATSSNGAEFERGVPGDMQYRVFEITFDDSYVTGGEPMAAADIGFSKIEFITFAGGDSGYVFDYDFTNSKVIVYRAAGSAAALQQVPNTTDLSAVITRAMAWGRP